MIEAMDEQLRASKELLRAGKAEEACLLLKRTGKDTPGNNLLAKACRSALAEQYAYLIKEKIDADRLAEAQELTDRYQRHLGPDAVVQQFATQIEQEETASSGLLRRMAAIPLEKAAKAAIGLFVALTAASIVLEYFV